MVYIWRGSHQYWSTDSTVGQHISAASSMLLPLFLDGVCILAVILSVIARLTRGKRQSFG